MKLRYLDSDCDPRDPASVRENVLVADLRWTKRGEIILTWAVHGVGFGEMTARRTKDGFEIDTEGVPYRFLRVVYGEGLRKKIGRERRSLRWWKKRARAGVHHLAQHLLIMEDRERRHEEQDAG